jgi:hypothetical protein
MNRSVLLVWAACLLAASMVQADGSVTFDKSAETKSQVVGKLTVGGTAEPLGEVNVLLRDEASGQYKGSATSSPNGMFAIQGVIPGTYTLEVYCADSAPGKPLDGYYLPPKIGPFTIPKGQDAKVAIVAIKGLSLKGQILAKGMKISPRSPIYRVTDRIEVLDDNVSSDSATASKEFEFAPGTGFKLSGLNPKAESIDVDILVPGIRPLCRVRITGGPFPTDKVATLAAPIQFGPVVKLTVMVADGPEQSSREGVWVEIRGVGNPYHRYVNASELRGEPWPVGRYAFYALYRGRRSKAIGTFTVSSRRPNFIQLDYRRFDYRRKQVRRDPNGESTSDARDIDAMKVTLAGAEPPKPAVVPSPVAPKPVPAVQPKAVVPKAPAPKPATPLPKPAAPKPSGQ